MPCVLRWRSARQVAIAEAKALVGALQAIGVCVCQGKTVVDPARRRAQLKVGLHATCASAPAEQLVICAALHLHDLASPPDGGVSIRPTISRKRKTFDLPAPFGPIITVGLGKSWTLKSARERKPLTWIDSITAWTGYIVAGSVGGAKLCTTTVATSSSSVCTVSR